MKSLVQVIPQKILIIQLRQLGDVILTTPLVRQVRKNYPNSEIHFLTEKLSASVYACNNYINKIQIIPQKLNSFQLLKYYFKIRSEKYDLVIDAHGNPKTAQIALFSGASQRIGFNFRVRNWAYTKKIQLENENEYSAISKLQLISHLHVNWNDYELDFFIPKQDELYGNLFFQKYTLPKVTIAFHVVSRRDYKIWDVKNYIALGNWLIEKGYHLLFTYGPGEIHMALEVYNGILLKEKALIEYSLGTLPQLISILKQCVFYLGNDGGVKHMAICAGIPTFTIFKNINWHNWTPPNSQKHVAIYGDKVTDDVSLEHVCDKLKNFL